MIAERWTPYHGDRQHDPFRHDEASAVLRAASEALPQTRAIDFSRELLVAVGANPGPDAPVVRVAKADVEVAVAVLWHPVWVVRGCAGRLAGNELFHATTREDGGTVWVLRQEATYRAPRRDAHYVVALREVEVPCPADARELIDRTIPEASVPTVADRAVRLPTYAIRERPGGEAGPRFDGVEFSTHSVVIGADEPVALPVRLIDAPAHAVRTVRVATYTVHHRQLLCKKRVRCEQAGSRACALDFEVVRRDERPVLARVADHGQVPVVYQAPGDVAADPDCPQQPRTYVVRSAEDPRAPRDVAVDFEREMLVGIDVAGVTAAGVAAPVEAAERGGAMEVTLAVPTHEVMEVFGCEGVTRQPCDPIARGTGKWRVRSDWPRVVAGALVRVPRSSLPVTLVWQVPAAAED